jgi:ABC-type multidrug transport system ATPase subunit
LNLHRDPVGVNPSEYRSGVPVIEVEGLRKEYRRRRGGRTVAIDGLDLEVPEGGVFGFLGPNGAGKTTTIRCLLGLVRASAGRTRLLGSEVPRGLPGVIGRVGSIVEAPALFPRFTGRRNLQLLGRLHGEGPSAVTAVLRTVDLEERADDLVKTYSLGMKQRLGIAGALLGDPRLLLLDEPANGLDPAGIVAMRETLRHLAAIGKTVFVSSHLLAEVQQLADVVGIIAAGRLVREGSMKELLAGEGIVRVRVAPEQVAAAAAALAGLVQPDHVVPSTPEPGWLTVQIAPDRTAEVNRTLANAAIYASGLESGNDLEELFLSLTHDPSAVDPDGTFAGLAKRATTSEVH